jgi:lipoate-protein ligase A
MTVWRLLVDGEADGPWNMGVDEALLNSAQQGLPTLRFYHWTGPWLSLGYGQRRHASRLEELEAQGLQVVHRITGGRAVLHGCDLTYSVTLPESLLPAGIQASYGKIADALVAGLTGLGLEVERSGRKSAAVGADGFDCFAAPAMDEICAQGRKLVGSAQRRAGGGVLQHGSIRFKPDSEAIQQAAGLVPGVATSLWELGCEADLDALRGSMIEAFSKAFAVNIESGELSSAERAIADRRERSPQPNMLS